MAHTPGPWIAANHHPNPAKGRSWSVSAITGDIARIPENLNNRDRMEANAHLIAAAPDLLEAAKQVYADYDKYMRGYRHSKDYTKHWQALRAAIAKAEKGDNQ